MLKSPLTALTLVALSLSLAACGTSSTVTAPEAVLSAAGAKALPNIAAFTANTTSLPYGGGPVTLAWNVTGASTLTIDQGVGTVTGTTSKAVTVPTTRTFTLTARNKWGSSQRSVTVAVSTIQPITVSGQVRTTTGVPISGAAVTLAGRAPVTTDASGNFNVADVVQPYTLSVTDPVTGVRQIYQGARTGAPVVHFSRTRERTYSAQLYGSVTGGEAGATTSLSISPRGFSNTTSTATGNYNLTTRWGEWENEPAGLHALQWVKDSAGRPERYTGYGNVVVKLMPNYTMNYGVTVSPVSSQGALGGQVNFPTGYTPEMQTALITYPRTTPVAGGYTIGGDTYPLEQVQGGTHLLYFRTPGITGATFTVMATATGPNGERASVTQRNLGWAHDGLQLNTFAAPRLNPVGTSTTYSWTDGLSGMYRATFLDQTTYTPVHIFTDRRDIPAQLLNLTPGNAVEWSVTRDDQLTVERVLTGTVLPNITSSATSAPVTFQAP